MNPQPRYSFEDRLALWSAQRETEPVYFDEKVQKWRLLDYATIARVLSDPATFSSDFAGLAPVAVAGSSRVDLCSALAFPLPVMVISELLGIPAADREVFEKWAQILFSDDQLPESPTMEEIEAALAQIAPTIREMTGYIRGHIQHRREHPDDGLTSKLVAVEVGGERLEDEEIIGFVALLLVAGHITTTALIGNTALCLDRHPEAAAALRADPGRLPTALEEVLRCLPPFNELGRRTTTEVTLSGRVIPADSVVAANLASANRDPAQFAYPDVFDISRSPNPHLSFGHGIHFCLGTPLARLEGRVAFEELFGRYQEIAIAADEPVEFQNEAVIISVKKLILEMSPAGGETSAVAARM